MTCYLHRVQVERSRERDRNQLAGAQATIAQLHSKLMMQRASQAQLHRTQAKTQADSELAFSAELLAFANKFE